MERLIQKVPHKILIIKPSSLGDIVHALPFLCVMHECFPAASIDWIVARGNEGLLEGNPMIRRLWIIDKDSWKKFGSLTGTVAEMANIARALRKEKYDMVIDLQGLMRSAVMTKATGARVRIGFSEAREGSTVFYTHKVRGGTGIHAVDRYLRIAAALGCDIVNVRFPMPLIREPEKITRLRKELGEYAVIVPGARWQTKRWPSESFGSLAALIRIRSVIVGNEADRFTAEQIAEQSRGNALSMAGDTDVAGLLCLIRGAKYVITNDSGPMHMAAAYGIPAVAIFGPTNPALTGPYGHGHIVVKTGVDCSPCRKRKCDDLRCMKEISVERVHQEIKSIEGRRQ
jgi:lipopolysaccharide heptosyltransferase I